MFSRLRQPGGAIGGLSVAAFLVLGILGIFGVVTLVIAAIAGNDWWSDSRSDQVFGAILFALVSLGAVGFWIMDRQLVLGTGLAILGSLAFAFILFWAILPLILGLVFAVTAGLRARALSELSAPAGHAPA